MAYKTAIKISKNNYITIKEKHKKVKRLQAYTRALVYVAKTVNIIFAKFAWTFINIEVSLLHF